MSTHPNVSVVITAYNYGCYIRQAIDSVLGQTYQDYEIVVIDDGSQDDTPAIMEQYRDNEGIRYIRQKNQGQPKAKNRGIAEAKGSLVAFLDADDVWLPQKLELQVELFRDEEVGVGYTRRVWIDPMGNTISGNERTLRRGNILDYIFIDNFVCFSSSMVRRELLLATKCFDETLPMGIDYDLWTRLAAQCKFDYVDQPLVKYRTGHTNLSQNTLKRYECAEKIMRKNLADPAIARKFSFWVPRYAWADTWKNKANFFRAKGDCTEALALYKKALMSFPFFPPAVLGILLCLVRKS